MDNSADYCWCCHSMSFSFFFILADLRRSSDVTSTTLNWLFTVKWTKKTYHSATEFTWPLVPEWSSRRDWLRWAIWIYTWTEMIHESITIKETFVGKLNFLLCLKANFYHVKWSHYNNNNNRNNNCDSQVKIGHHPGFFYNLSPINNNNSISQYYMLLYTYSAMK